MKKKTNKPKPSSNSLGLTPQSLVQSLYMESIEENDVTISVGYAGSGKTYIAATAASQFKIDHKAKGRIILTRPNRDDSPTMGFLPGEDIEKMTPWVRPYLEVFNKHLNGTTTKYLEDGTISVIAFEHIQGLTFDDAYVLLDEAQFTTRSEMKKFLKRIGKNTKVIINGDIAQANMGKTSGLAMLIDLWHSDAEVRESVGLVEFNDVNDIVRSDFCRMITPKVDKLPN